jgi:hypothetical protein
MGRDPTSPHIFILRNGTSDSQVMREESNNVVEGKKDR